MLDLYVIKIQKRLKRLYSSFKYNFNYMKKASVIADKSYNALIIGENKKAYYLFSKALKISKYDNADKILECFSLFFKDTSHKYLHPDNAHKSNNENKKRIKLILVEGMSNSGNGATFDYLNQSDKVFSSSKEAIKIVREAYGLNDLLATAEEKEYVYPELIIFFANHIIGLSYGKLTHNNRFQSLFAKIPKSLVGSRISSRKKMLSSSQLDIINSFCRFISFLKGRNFIINHDEDFGHALNDFVHNYIKSINTKVDTDYIMVRNMFKVSKRNFRAAKYMDEYWYIYTTRDPRDRFVELYHRGSDSSVEEYVDKFRESIEYLNLSIKSKDIDKKNVIHVQFEDLVLSEKFRANLIKKIGLDPETFKIETLFKPHESKKNIGKYKSFKNKDAIKYIEENLDEYLYNL